MSQPNRLTQLARELSAEFLDRLTDADADFALILIDDDSTALVASVEGDDLQAMLDSAMDGQDVEVTQ